MSATALPSEPKGSPWTRVVRAVRIDAASRSTLVREVRITGLLAAHPRGLAVGDDGALAFEVPGGLRLCAPDGSEVELKGYLRAPLFDREGRLRVYTHGADGPRLVTYDLQGREVASVAYDTGAMECRLLPATGDIVGFGGWLAPDGTVTPLGEELTSTWDGAPLVSGDGAIFSRKLEGPGETVHVTRAGTRTVIDDHVAAASADGKCVITVRLPSVEEAHAQGRSQYAARIVELVDRASGARRRLRSVQFPSGRVLAWPTADDMLLVEGGVVHRYDPTTDSFRSSRPHRTLAIAMAGSKIVSAHEDRLRAREGAETTFVAGEPGSLIASPGGKRLLVWSASHGWAVLDASSLRPLCELGKRKCVAFAGDDHVVAVTEGGQAEIVRAEGDGAAAVELAGCQALAGLDDGFVAFFEKRIERRGADGQVRERLDLTAKLAKTFRSSAVQWARAHGGAIYVHALGRLFRWDASGMTHVMLKVEKTLGGANLKSVAISPGGRVALSVFHSLESWNGVVVVDSTTEEVLGWTGAYGEAPVGLEWSSASTLLVAERIGLVRAFEVG